MRYLALLLAIFLLVACSQSKEDGIESMSSMEKRNYISELGYSGDEKAASDILPFLEDADPKVIGTAAFFLGYLNHRDSISKLHALLGSPDHEVVNMAGSGLAYMVNETDDYLLQSLYGVLQNPNLLARMSAIETIGKIKSKDSVGVILPIFKEEEPAAQLQIIQALGEIGSVEVLPFLYDYLEEVKAMDHNQPRKGGVRGTPPHPEVIQIVVEKAIEAIKNENV